MSLSPPPPFTLGVCYYPEHWPRENWPDDARRMRALGLDLVRIGEFAWSRIEPEPGRYDWHWLDEAVATLADAGLQIVFGTPTATPPKWLIDAHPEILATDEYGRPRRFGSRRHYCFSSPVYREHSGRIVAAVADRYGRHPAVVAWQTDNEYGCHDTVLSYSPAALAAFRDWLKRRYSDVDALNRAWGGVFWSQQYRDFSEVDAPVATVTEANPSQRLDYRRCASDQVVSYNRLQTGLIRARSPGRALLHNFMGFFTEFDHYDVAADLDAAGWDSYPLGFLDQGWFDEEQKQRYQRCGHPDLAAFHHDLYRGVGRGRWWVLEQQPGPVNWAPYNPAPRAGAVRLWTWEAFAHGAEAVCYFRWRQAPFAQEQMHAGLNRPDGAADQASDEVATVAAERERLRGLAAIAETAATPAPVALWFDYPAQWLFQIQPQGADFNYLRLVFEWYSALRGFGVDIDILPPSASLDGYRALLIPSLPVIEAGAAARLRAFTGPVLIGPRSGSKTAELQIPAELAPGPLAALLGGLQVLRVESLRPGSVVDVRYGNRNFTLQRWREQVDPGSARVLAHGDDGWGALFEHRQYRYLAGWPCAAGLSRLCRQLCETAGVEPLPLPADLRLRRRGELRFAFHFGPDTTVLPESVGDGDFLLGQRRLGPAGVAVWKSPTDNR